jgi:hypothetical protein
VTPAERILQLRTDLADLSERVEQTSDPHAAYGLHWRMDRIRAQLARLENPDPPQPPVEIPVDPGAWAGDPRAGRRRHAEQVARFESRMLRINPDTTAPATPDIPPRWEGPFRA